MGRKRLGAGAYQSKKSKVSKRKDGYARAPAAQSGRIAHNNNYSLCVCAAHYYGAVRGELFVLWQGICTDMKTSWRQSFVSAGRLKQSCSKRARYCGIGYAGARFVQVSNKALPRVCIAKATDNMMATRPCGRARSYSGRYSPSSQLRLLSHV